MSFVPLAEGGSIDLDNGALDEGVRPDELVVGSVVDLTAPLRTTHLHVHRPCTYDREDPSLASGALARPRKVASLETEGPVLQVSSTDTHGVDTLGTELRVGGLATELELSLLAVVGALGPRMRPFVPGGTGYTCATPIPRQKVQLYE